MASDTGKKSLGKNSRKKPSVSQFVGTFKRFSLAGQLKIAEQINRELFAHHWALLDAALPDVEISEEEVLAELLAVRKHGKEKAA